jgi:hypothetical protein
MIKMMKLKSRREVGAMPHKRNKQDEYDDQQDVHESSTAEYFWCLYIPFFNLLYSISKEEPPASSKLRELLQLLLLASSLMLLTSASIYFSYDHNGIIEALDRWHLGGMYYDRELYEKHYAPDCTECLGDVDDFNALNWRPFSMFTGSAALAIVLLALSTLSSTMCYIYIIATSFRGPKRKPSKQMTKAMWVWIRILVVVSFVTFVGGTVFTFIGIIGAFEYMMPNPVCLALFDPKPGCPPEAYSFFGKFGFVWSRIKSPSTFYMSHGLIFTFGGWAILTIIAGFGLRAKTQAYRSLEEGVDTTHEEDSEERLELHSAGIDSEWHEALIAAELSVTTLKAFSDDLVFTALYDAGITKPGQRLKIMLAIRKSSAPSNPPNLAAPKESSLEHSNRFPPSTVVEESSTQKERTTVDHYREVPSTGILDDLSPTVLPHVPSLPSEVPPTAPGRNSWLDSDGKHA